MSILTMCHSSTLAVRAKQFSQVLALEIPNFHGVGAAQSVSVGCQSKIRTTFKILVLDSLCQVAPDSSESGFRFLIAIALDR